MQQVCKQHWTDQIGNAARSVRILSHLRQTVQLLNNKTSLQSQKKKENKNNCFACSENSLRKGKCKSLKPKWENCLKTWKRRITISRKYEQNDIRIVAQWASMFKFGNTNHKPLIKKQKGTNVDGLPKVDLFHKFRLSRTVQYIALISRSYKGVIEVRPYLIIRFIKALPTCAVAW